MKIVRCIRYIVEAISQAYGLERLTGDRICTPRSNLSAAGPRLHDGIYFFLNLSICICAAQ